MVNPVQFTAPGPAPQAVKIRETHDTVDYRGYTVSAPASPGHHSRLSAPGPKGSNPAGNYRTYASLNRVTAAAVGTTASTLTRGVRNLPATLAMAAAHHAPGIIATITPEYSEARTAANYAAQVVQALG